MKKILFISPAPPNHLNRIKILNLLNAFKGQAEINFVCLASTKKDYEYLDKYKELYKKVAVFRQPRWLSNIQCLWGVIKRHSLRVSYCYSKELHRYLSHINNDPFDIIYIATLRMVQYAHYFPNEKVWIDLTDSMSLYYNRFSHTHVSFFDTVVAWYEGKFFRKYEKETLKNYKTIFCSKIDQKYSQKQCSLDKKPSIVIPNVVDLENFPLVPGHKNSSTYKICYWGMLKAPFNYTAVEILLYDIFPKLLEKSSHFRLDIIGPDTPEHLLKNLSEYVTFSGYVQELAAKLSHMDLFVCPLLLGAGVNNKILQSIACGLPVLTTTIGVEGIERLEELVKRKLVLIEDNIEKYPKLIWDFSQNRNRVNYQEMRDFIEKNYSINALRAILVKKGFI